MQARQQASRSAPAVAPPAIAPPTADRGNAFAQQRLQAQRGGSPNGNPGGNPGGPPAGDPASGGPIDFPHRADLEASLGTPIPGTAVLDRAGCAARGVPAWTVGLSAHFATLDVPLDVAAHEAAHLLQHAGRTGDAGLGAEGHAQAVEGAVTSGGRARGLLGGGARVGGGTHNYTASSKKQVEIYGYYENKADQQTLADDINASGKPATTDVYMGNYGLSQDQADIAHSVKGGKYAPLIRANMDKDPSYYKAREDGVKGDKAHAGQIPSLSELVDEKKDGKIKNVQYNAYLWGIEAGRRFRDEIKDKQAKGMQIDSWQFDEIWPSASVEDGGKSGVTGAMKREYLRGFVEGLCKGREGDAKMKGIVHIAHMSALTKLGDDGEMKKFWGTLNDCASYIVGEEYPGMDGGTADAKKKADSADSAVDKLATFGKAGKSLASKYVAGMTPGLRGTSLYSSLGGKGKGETTKQVDAWRDAYIAEREKNGVAGLGEYNWLGDSMSDASETTKDVSAGVKKG